MKPWWSFYNSYHPQIPTKFTIGGYDANLVQPGSQFIWYNVDQGMQWNPMKLWMIDMTDIKIDGISFFMNEYTSKFHFDPLADAIHFTPEPHKKVTAYLTKLLPGLDCTLKYRLCQYPDICSTIVDKMGSWSFTLGKDVYSVPGKLFVRDNHENGTCSVLVKQHGIQRNHVCMGSPFLMAFMSLHNQQNKSVGIAPVINSLGTRTLKGVLREEEEISEKNDIQS